MKSILVPTDFSKNACKALAYAAKLASHCGALVHIVHAYTPLENVLSGRGSLRESWNENRKQEKAAALLQVQQDIVERYPGLQFETHLYLGSTAEVLLTYCDTAQVDLIVMGKHGTAGLGRIFMGSTTADMIGKSQVPVMAIPEEYELKKPSSLVLASRDFERDTRVTDPVFELASLFDLPVHVLVFAEENQVEANIMRKAAELADYVAWLRKQYPLARITGSHSEGDDLDEALAGYCEKNGTGILCMLTHHRGFWDNILNPSKTKEMAFRSSIPLLAVPV